MTEQAPKTWTVQELMDRFASGEPVPGGGSAAALTAALAAALLAKVATLAARRHKGLADAPTKALRLAQQALTLVEKDAQAYQAVERALKLPKGSEKEKKARAQAVQHALVAAAEVPMETAQAALKILALAEQLVPRCPTSAHSDLATAVKLAWTAGTAALFSVDANALALEDAETQAELSEKRTELELALEERAAWALAPLEEHLRSWLGERDSNPH